MSATDKRPERAGTETAHVGESRDEKDKGEAKEPDPRKGKKNALRFTYINVNRTDKATKEVFALRPNEGIVFASEVRLTDGRPREMNRYTTYAADDGDDGGVRIAAYVRNDLVSEIINFELRKTMVRLRLRGRTVTGIYQPPKEDTDEVREPMEGPEEIRVGDY